MSEAHNRFSRRRIVFYSLLLLVFSILAWAALMAPLLIRFSSPSLQAGQVISQDVLASQDITYTSEVLTRQKREAAGWAVLPVYTSPNTSVARQQLERLRAALAYISSVRADSYADLEQKQADLNAMEDLQLGPETMSAILEMSDSRWQTIQQETIVVLEQVMRNIIRTDRVNETRNSVPALVSLALPEKQAVIVAELAAVFVAPNSLYSESLTEAARLEAEEAVEPVSRSFVAGEKVISRGTVLDEADIEALQSLGLARPNLRWQDPISAASLVLLMIAFVMVYLRRRQNFQPDARKLTVIAFLYLGFLTLVRLVIPGHTILPYVFPLAAYSLVIAAFFGPELALISSLPLAVAAAFGMSNALELTLFYVMSSFFGVMALGRARQIISLLWAAAAVALAGAAVILVYRLPGVNIDWIGLATLGGAAAFNGIASASLTFFLQMLLAHLVGMTTPMQLMDLTRPDHPLMQLILRESPGTYQHSLQVANLAEQAAEGIGADALLTRVGALYHDAGKTLNPVFFIENQVPGFLNPHDDLDSATSAATIIRHVPDGLALARKYRLPQRMLDFIAEHHGTMLTRYQYARAVALAGGDESQVEKDKFRYPGPRPQSRETAILMLADGCEARVRAELPKDEDELRRVIKSVIENRISSGQLDDTSLTLRDLDAIYNSFAATLRGIYHPRIQYPNLETQPKVEDTIPIVFPSPRSKELTVRSPSSTTSQTP